MAVAVSSALFRVFHAVLGTTCSTKYTTVSNSLPYPTLSAPLSHDADLYCYCTSSRAPHLLRISIFQTTPTLLHTLARLLFRLQFIEGASFLRTEAASYTIQSLVGYILPSHQFLHSIQTPCFLILYWLSLLYLKNLTCTPPLPSFIGIR